MADQQLPGTMIVDDPQSPWEAAFGAYRQALVDLNGDGKPDIVIPTTPPSGDQRPPSAFDPDGKPRVPASGGANPYPDYKTEDVSYAEGGWRELLNPMLYDPGGALKGGLQRVGDIAAAAGQAAGPPGAIIGAAGRMMRTPMAVIPGRRAAAATELAPIHAQEAAQAAQSERGFAQFMQRFEPSGQPALGYDKAARPNAMLEGMVLQRNNRNPVAPGVVRPEADPARIAASQREADAIAKGNFRMDRQAQTTAELNSPTRQTINRDANIDETMQRWLGAVAQRTGVQPDQLARIPRGEFERFIANEPGLKLLMQRYGMSLDDVVGSLATRGYAVPPSAPFNGSVVQGRNGGQFAPMSQDERALRDALHRRNAPPSGNVQIGGVF